MRVHEQAGSHHPGQTHKLASGHWAPCTTLEGTGLTDLLQTEGLFYSWEACGKRGPKWRTERVGVRLVITGRALWFESNFKHKKASMTCLKIHLPNGIKTFTVDYTSPTAVSGLQQETAVSIDKMKYFFNRGRISLVGRALDCKAGGWGSIPGAGPILRLLKQLRNEGTNLLCPGNG